jgi:hypothetical protein
MKSQPLLRLGFFISVSILHSLYLIYHFHISDYPLGVVQHIIEWLLHGGGRELFYDMIILSLIYQAVSILL